MGNKSPGLFLLGVGFVFLAVIIWMLFGRNNQPVYQGRTLSAWIRRLPAAGNNGRGVMWAPLDSMPETSEQREAEVAVRHIGTNALPYLLAELHAKDGIEEEFAAARNWAGKAWQGIISRGKPNAFQPVNSSQKVRTSGERRHWNAARGLHALGPMATPVIPELVGMLKSSGPGYACPDAAYALSAMGPEGVAAMMPILTNSPHPGDWPQVCVIWALGQTPGLGKNALPELLSMLQNSNAVLRMSATWTLGQLHTQPQLVAPALAANLGDSGFNIRWMTEEALKEYGIDRVTLPALRGYLNDPQLHIRKAATNAMRALFPEEITQK